MTAFVVPRVEPKRNYQGSQVHPREFLLLSDFRLANLFREGFQGQLGIGCSRDHSPGDLASVTCETVHRPLALLVDHVLQGFSRIVFGPGGETVPQEGEFPASLGGCSGGLRAKWFGPDAPYFIEGFLIEIRREVGLLRQQLIATCRGVQTRFGNQACGCGQQNEQNRGAYEIGSAHGKSSRGRSDTARLCSAVPRGGQEGTAKRDRT